MTSIWQEVELAKISGMVSHRTLLLLERAYFNGYLDKALRETTDMEFSSLYGCGPKTLKEIHRAVPRSFWKRITRLIR